MTAPDVIAFLGRAITGATARWSGCEPSVRPRIYFANHTSNLDALLLWSVLPAEVRRVTRPVAARDYWTRGPVRRWLAERVFRAVLIERKKPTVKDNPLRDMLEAMGDRNSLILFPEGGRFPGEKPEPFKTGLHHLAERRPDVELVPCHIENMNRMLPKGEVLPVPLMGGVTFGRPIRLEEGETRQAFLERARDCVIQLAG